MKTKLLVFFGLVVMSIGLFSIVPTTSVYAALKCGDPGFTGPCQNPFNPTTADCSKVTNESGNREQCTAIKSCISEGGANKPRSECQAAWTACVTSYGDAQINYAYCQDKVGAGKFAEANKGKDPNAGPAGDKTTCAIDGIGWILCPVITTGAKIVDGAYYGVSILLTVPAIDTSTGSPMFKAWSIMRNFANVAFVIAFMIIIYSQITGVGVSNYGIKKLLPRIFVAAILVNVSYWVCAIAVDLSNIAGTSLKGMLEGTSNQLFNPDTQSADGATGVWGGLAATVLVGGALLYVGLSALLPLLVVALLAIVTVILVLTLRQALIIILIVISPLAFVAYLLPNTSSWFDKWRGLFTTLLLMFPIIAIIFGGSALASTIIGQAAAADGNNIILQTLAAAVQIVPLLVTPIVMKTAGGLLNRFGGIVNNKNKGPFDRMRKSAEGVRKRQEGRREIRALNGGASFGRGRYERRARKGAIGAGIEANVKRAQGSYVADTAVGNESFQNQLAGGINAPTKLGQPLHASAGATNQALANAINTKMSLQMEEVKAANAIIQNANLSSGQQQALALGKQVTDTAGNPIAGLSGANTALRAAAIQNQMKSTLGEAEEIITSSGNINTGNQEADTMLRQAIADGVYAGGHNNKANYLAGDMGDRIKAGEIKSSDDLDNAAARRIEKGKMSAEAVKSQDSDALKRFAKVASAAKAGQQYDLGGAGAPNVKNVSDIQLVAISESATKVKTDPELSRQVTTEQAPHIDSLHNL